MKDININFSVNSWGIHFKLYWFGFYVFIHRSNGLHYLDNDYCVIAVNKNIFTIFDKRIWVKETWLKNK